MIIIFLINILSKQCSSSKHGIIYDTHVGNVEQAELQSSVITRPMLGMKRQRGAHMQCKFIRGWRKLRDSQCSLLEKMTKSLNAMYLVTCYNGKWHKCACCTDSLRTVIVPWVHLGWTGRVHRDGKLQWQDLKDIIEFQASSHMILKRWKISWQKAIKQERVKTDRNAQHNSPLALMTPSQKLRSLLMAGWSLWHLQTHLSRKTDGYFVMTVTNVWHFPLTNSTWQSVERFSN